MEDLTLRYFDAEMRYLREAAKEFAQTHPDRAAMLDLDKAGTPDPYVERLFNVVMQEQIQPGELRYAIDAELKGVGLVRYGTEFMPEGRVLIRHLKQQQYLDNTARL